MVVVGSCVPRYEDLPVPYGDKSGPWHGQGQEQESYHCQWQRIHLIFLRGSTKRLFQDNCQALSWQKYCNKQLRSAPPQASIAL